MLGIMSEKQIIDKKAVYFSYRGTIEIITVAVHGKE